MGEGRGGKGEGGRVEDGEGGRDWGVLGMERGSGREEGASVGQLYKQADFGEDAQELHNGCFPFPRGPKAIPVRKCWLSLGTNMGLQPRAPGSPVPTSNHANAHAAPTRVHRGHVEPLIGLDVVGLYRRQTCNEASPSSSCLGRPKTMFFYTSY